MSAQGRQYPDGPLEPPPGVSISEQYRAAGAGIAAAFVAGLNDPRPLTAQEMADLAAHAGGVARRSFPALYEDDEP